MTHGTSEQTKNVWWRSRVPRMPAHRATHEIAGIGEATLKHLDHFDLVMIGSD